MRTFVAACAVMMALASSAEANTYNINISDTTGQVTAFGTVTSDGTIGVLASANITDFSIVLNMGSGPLTITGPAQPAGVTCFGPINGCTVPIIGPAFSATATSLLFDFSSTSLSAMAFIGYDNQGHETGSLSFRDAAVSTNPSSITINVSGNTVNLLPNGFALDAQTGLTIVSENLIPPEPSHVGVPSPIAGAGLPGLIIAFGGVLAWCRRRKAAAIAA